MSRPYIDPVRLDLRLFQVTLLLLGLRGEFPKSLQQVILVPLMYLGWGRGGLRGEGSSVVELGENPVPWSNPRDLDIRWKRVALSREGVGGLDSRDLSWSRGCEGGVTASRYWLLCRRRLLVPWFFEWSGSCRFEWFNGY